MATKDTLEARAMIIQREWNSLGTKQNFENIIEDKYNQMRSSRQIDKLEQWVTHSAVKDEVLRSILGRIN